MSQNVTSATLKGLKKYDTKKSQSKVQTIEQEGEGNISTWNTLETTLPDRVETEINPFEARQIGVSKRVQEKTEER